MLCFTFIPEDCLLSKETCFGNYFNTLKTLCHFFLLCSMVSYEKFIHLNRCSFIVNVHHSLSCFQFFFSLFLDLSSLLSICLVIGSLCFCIPGSQLLEYVSICLFIMFKKPLATISFYILFQYCGFSPIPFVGL